jgi:hypothetical protein
MSEKSRLAILCVAFILLGLIVGVRSAQTASPFTPGPGSPITTGPGSTFVATGDLNGDGKPDVVVVNSGTGTNGNSISILLATSGGAFTTPVNVPVGPSPADVAIGDVNGDGRPDLVVTNSNDTISVLLNVGGGAFAAPSTLPDFAGSLPEGVAIADVNHDGANDIIVTNSAGNSVTLYLGAGFGTFAPPVKISTTAPGATSGGSGPSGVAVADFNNDGNLDLATSNNDGTATILLGNGNGTFQPAVNINLTPSSTSTCGDPDAIVSADLNTDAKPDIAIACTGGTVSVLIGNGDGTFQTPVSYSTVNGTAGSGPEAIAAADFDGKNGIDLVIADTSNAAVILLNNGNGTFTPSGSTTVNTACVTAGNGAFGVAAADFNGDGKPDMAVANSIDGTVSILLNGGAVAAGAGCGSSGGGGGGGGTTANFTVVVTPPSVTTTAGVLVTYTVTVTPGPGFSEPVALTCSSAAPASGCSLSPKTVTPRGGPVTSTMSVATNFTSAGGAQFGSLSPPEAPAEHPSKALYAMLSFGGVGIFGLVLPAGRSRNRRRRLLGLAAASLLAVLMLIGLEACGKGGGGISQKTPKGTFTITATGTSGSGTTAANASGNASLVVQ